MKTGYKELRCGLIGRTLSHSYSPEIHSLLADYEYRLFEMEEEEVEAFIRHGEWDAINVTIPYKKTVMPFLDEISDEALRIGSVNTVVRGRDGLICGYNTDYFGFNCMLKSAGINVEGKKVLILGSGGASMTARTAVTDMGGRYIIISRSGEDNYTNLSRHSDCDVIINTTPVGMYPNNGVSPIDLGIFPHLEGVADLIYNPSRTELILEAERRGVRCVSGLSMLVAQAAKACALFTGESEDYDSSEIDEIIGRIETAKKNIVLIGMPGCGKSTVGKLLAKSLGREFVDTDEEAVRRDGREIPRIFAESGEEYFRQVEREVISDFAKKSSLVISVGGGAVTRAENRRAIRENSTAVLVMRSFDRLSKEGRPISQKKPPELLWEERREYYLSTADITVNNDGTPEETVREISEALGI